MFAIASLALTLLTQLGPDEVGPLVQPATYSSPSGAWQLSVDPTRRSGAGAASYRMLHDGLDVWSGERAFTLFDAHLDERGYVGGSTDLEGRKRSGECEFVFPILSPSGEAVICDGNVSAFFGSCVPPRESLRGTFVHGDLDRFVVRAKDSDGERWRVYRLSSGERLADVDPRLMLEDPRNVESSLAVAPIAGTPLTCVQWWHTNRLATPEREHGARFVVCDADWRAVWSLALPRDYLGGDEETRLRTWTEIAGGGGIVPVGEPREFAVRLCADGVIATYRVEQDATATRGWRVTEVGRRSIEAPQRAGIEHVRLREVASVPLRAPLPREPIRDIAAFAFDASGNTCFVRGEPEPRTYTLVTLDGTGNVSREVPIGPIAPEERGALLWTPLVDGDWLVSLSDLELRVSKVWRVRSASGELDLLADLGPIAIVECAAAPDSGFATLVEDRGSRYAWPRSVVRFDAQARELWRLPSSLELSADTHFESSASLAVASDGAVLLLDHHYGAPDRLLRITAEGEFAGATSLQDAWDVPPLAAPTLVALRDGVVLVGSRKTHWFRTDSTGRLLETFELRDAPSEWVSGWRADAGGRLWCSDRDHLFAFELSGELRESFGGRITADELQGVKQAAVDANGNIGLVDARTQRLHVYAPTGEPVAEPNDSWNVLNRDWRELFERAAPGWKHDEERNSVKKLDAVGDVELVVERRADHRFFTVVRAIGLGRGGELAVLETPPYYDAESPSAVSLYSRDGAPLRTVDLPLPSEPRSHLRQVEVGERWLLVADAWGRCAVLVSRLQGPPLLVELARAHGADSYGKLVLSPDEHELWHIDFRPPTLRRYALPSD